MHYLGAMGSEMVWDPNVSNEIICGVFEHVHGGVDAFFAENKKFEFFDIRTVIFLLVDELVHKLLERIFGLTDKLNFINKKIVYVRGFACLLI